MMLDLEGLQMASSPTIAQHKAARFAASGQGTQVLDLCCGIGADAMALAAAGLRPLAVDIDPVRIWMTQHNAHCDTALGDVTVLDLPCIPLHIDPQRRTSAGSRRTPSLSDLVPPLPFLEHLALHHPACCIKLFPGVPFDALPEGEVEIVSEGGRVRQALLWTGTLARAPRSATSFPAGATINGEPGRPPVGPLGSMVYSVDPAIERAELLGSIAQRHDLATPHPAVGLLTSDGVVDSPWLTRFEVLAFMPWSMDRVKSALAERGAGIVEVKTRGHALDPDVLQRRLRGSGDALLTVFVLRFGDAINAIIARRAIAPAAAS
jgi:hypothetical protein